MEPRIRDAEVMRDLVVDRVGDRHCETVDGPVGADERSAEDRDLAGQRSRIG